MKSAIAILLLSLTGTAAIGQTERDLQLDQALARQDYAGILTLLYPQASGGEAPSAAQQQQGVEWLKRPVDAGHVPLAYLLSWEWIDRAPAKAIRLNARARTGLLLTASECATQVEPPLAAALERIGLDASLRFRSDNQAWMSALRDALSWHKQQPQHPSAAWFCGAQNLLPPAAAEAAREAVWQQHWQASGGNPIQR